MSGCLHILHHVAEQTYGEQCSSYDSMLHLSVSLTVFVDYATAWQQE